MLAGLLPQKKSWKCFVVVVEITPMRWNWTGL